MVGCSVLGCKSRSEQKHENVTFHSYPADPVTKKQWITATGRMNWEPTKFSKMCSMHFDENSFTMKNKNKRLNRYSLPVKNVHGIVTTTAVKKRKSNDNASPLAGSPKKRKIDDEDLPGVSQIKPESLAAKTTAVKRKLKDNASPAGSPKKKKVEDKSLQGVLQTKPEKEHSPALETESYTPRKKKMMAKIRKLKQSTRNLNNKLRAVRQSHKRLIKKTADLKLVLDELKSKLLMGPEQLDLLETIGGGNVDIIKAFLNKKTKTKKYSEPIRKFALCLNFISPKAYEFVRKEFDTCLPHPKTLSKWYSCIECEPGFTAESFEAIKNIVNKSTSKIVCAISLDEMSIRQHIQWDGRKTMGYVNVGDNFEGDNLPLAKDALVFMLTALNAHWKLPLGYFLTSGVNGEQRSNLLENCVQLVAETGVEVISVTCDGCPANFAMAKILGAKFDDPTNIQPTMNICGKQIVMMPDACHMVKLVRNTLGDKKNILDGNNELVSWDFITKLHDLQENEGLHMANKLRKTHVNYKKQIMKVRLATQTFSRSVADSISFCKNKLNLPEFLNSDATVRFIQYLNNLFDILNSRRLSAPGFKKPISPQNWPTIQSFLEVVGKYLLELRFPDGQMVIKSSRKTGFLGLLISIECINVIYYQFVYRDDPRLKYLTMYRMSQDHLELFFSAIRSKGGFNNNPTAVQFKAAYKRLLIHGELKNVNSGNCLDIENVNILTCSKSAIDKINRTKNRLLSIDYDAEENHDIEIDLIDFPDGHDYIGQTTLTQFSKEIVTYIAGFIITKMTKQIKCDECNVALLGDKFEGLIAHKDRGGLHYPSRDVISVCTYAEDVLRNTTKIHGVSSLSKEKTMMAMVSKIMKKFMGKSIFDNLNDHIKEQNPMDNHIIMLIKAISIKFLDVRINHITKTVSQSNEKIRNFHTKLILFQGQ